MALAALVAVGFVALGGHAETGADCSGTLNSLRIAHPGTTWVEEGDDLVLLNDYGSGIRVPCAAPGQPTSLGPPFGVWESAPGILQPPSAYPDR